MVPQARSEATRQRILDAAIDLFSEVGYAAAALGEIIERAGMTNGALYHHFDSKEALATVIIEQGSNLTHDAFRRVCESSSPALENLIHGVFVITDLLVCDKRARTAEQLTRALAEFNSAASQVGSTRLDAMTTQASRASTEGDLCEGLDPHAVSESILNAMLGAQLLAQTAHDNDHITRLTRSIELLLPAIVADTSLAYFRQFLAREFLRHARAHSQTLRPRTIFFELATKALAPWEDAVYPRPVSRCIRQLPREHELPAPRDLGRWGPHPDVCPIRTEGARGLMTHEWAHESRAAQ